MCVIDVTSKSHSLRSLAPVRFEMEGLSVGRGLVYPVAHWLVLHLEAPQKLIGGLLVTVLRRR